MAAQAPTTVVALLTVHNRCATTERGLLLLDAAAAEAGVALRRVVVDDGSSDGTPEMLTRVRRPGDVVVRGPGDLFWAGGMRRAFAEVEEPFDHLLLLNDDVVLRSDALVSLLDRADGRTDRLVVGQVVDPVSGLPTYGGWGGRAPPPPLGHPPSPPPPG